MLLQSCLISGVLSGIWLRVGSGQNLHSHKIPAFLASTISPPLPLHSLHSTQQQQRDLSDVLIRSHALVLQTLTAVKVQIPLHDLKYSAWSYPCSLLSLSTIIQPGWPYPLPPTHRIVPSSTWFPFIFFAFNFLLGWLRIIQFLSKIVFSEKYA